MSLYDTPQKSSDLVYRLRGLGMGGAILHIGAHPDDEDVGLMAYMARKFCARIVYWSATRGEGGQNRIGPDKEEALGVYRTWETLAARAVDGGKTLFGPFYDFGFSKSGADTLTKWGGRQLVVREIVRAIRLVQPQIVIGRWAGQPSDGHGHHQAIGEVTSEAFEASGDPDQFPELRAQGLVAWQPVKLYLSTGGDWQPGEEGGVLGAIQPELERNGFVRINTGEFDQIAGRTYQEQAWIALNSHRTQAMGFIPKKGNFYYYYRLNKSLIAVPDMESSFYDGLDSSLTGLADYPGDGSSFLHEKLEVIKARAETAVGKFRVDDTMEAAASLLEGISLLRKLRASLPSKDLDDESRQALDLYLKRKLVEFEDVTAQCLGLTLECLSEHARITPGQRFSVTARLWNQRDILLDHVQFKLSAPDDWEIQAVTHMEAGQRTVCTDSSYDVTITEAADLSCPYWLVKPRELFRYHWPGGEPSGRPFDPPLVALECKVALGSNHITLREPAVFREAFAGGFRELSLAVVPSISLHPRNHQEYLQVRPSEQHLELQAVARSNVGQAVVEGSLKLDVPPGWQVEPSEIHLNLGPAGDSSTASFSVMIPEKTSAGLYPLRYVVQCSGRDYGVMLTPVRMGAPGLSQLPDQATCIKEEFITTPAVVNTYLFDVRFVPGLRYAYIQGVDENILKALTHFDLAFHPITDDEMGYLDLDQFDAIVIGPNAYLVRDELRKNASRLNKYVEQGGTLIVQYQGYGYERDQFVPYPFQFHQPHDRVTSEDAPVKVLGPDHFVFNQPNSITTADFDGWVRDRGLYFFGRWDKRYEPLLACSDPGEEPKKGGLLITSYGRGTFIYTGYSFFRQLPAGVPGAFRLFANILAVPAARILQRVGFLKNVSLFGFMNEEQLQTVARIMSERWETDGAFLCHQGDEGDEMYIIVQGEVNIIKESEGKTNVIYLAKQGEAIGEMQVLSKSPRTASMQAKGDIHLLVIEGTGFRSLMHQYPDMTDQVIQMLVQKLAAA